MQGTSAEITVDAETACLVQQPSRYDTLAGTYTATIGLELRCGIVVNRPSIRRVDARKRVFSVTWVLTGGGVYYERVESGAETVHALGEGSLLLRRPDRAGQLRLDSGGSQRRCFIDVDPSLAPVVIVALPELVNMPPVTPLPFNTLLLERFAVFVKSLEKMETSRPLEYITALTSMICALYRLSEVSVGQDGPMLKAARLLATEPVGVTLPDIAERCGVTYGTFRKRFIEAFGQTPGKWRILRRIERAKQELAAGEQIMAVADHLAYSDVYSFTHQFRSVTGVTPKQYQLRNIL
ncbi:MAG: AraC family transcriptional regulator [Oscillospiraceae bacterium]|nr:AraC family transcriptional regulator [Oscillospiraceae bacterium]